MLRYGVEYFITQKNHSGGNVSLLPTAIPPGPANIIKDVIKAFTFQKDFYAFVTILRSVSDVKILSKPNLLVQDGETSKIQIGSDEPQGGNYFTESFMILISRSRRDRKESEM